MQNLDNPLLHKRPVETADILEIIIATLDDLNERLKEIETQLYYLAHTEQDPRQLELPGVK